MHILLKSTLIAIGFVSAFWVGQVLLSPQAMLQSYTPPTVAAVEPYHSEETLRTLQQTVEDLQTRLAGMEAVQRNLAALNSRLAQLEAVQRGLSQKLDALPPDAVALETQSTFADEAEDEGTFLAWEEEAAVLAQERVDHVATVFWQESHDPAWAVETETAIQQAWDGGNLPASQLLDVACRSTMCRIEVGHDDEEAHEQFMLTMPMIMPFAIDAVFQPLIEGDPTSGTVVYLARAD